MYVLIIILEQLDWSMKIKATLVLQRHDYASQVASNVEGQIHHNFMLGCWPCCICELLLERERKLAAVPNFLVDLVVLAPTWASFEVKHCKNVWITSTRFGYIPELHRTGDLQLR